MEDQNIRSNESFRVYGEGVSDLNDSMLKMSENKMSFNMKKKHSQSHSLLFSDQSEGILKFLSNKNKNLEDGLIDNLNKSKSNFSLISNNSSIGFDNQAGI